VTPEENIAYWEALLATVADAAPDIAAAMAKTMVDRVVNVELKMISHSPGMFWKAYRGLPPAYVTGNLDRSIHKEPAVGSGMFAVSNVFSDAVYAGIQEFGGYTWGNHGLMHWRNSAGSWFMRSVYVPKHPYMGPALEAIIRDGTLQGSAIFAFEQHMSPVIR
jgi:hypothetical protein